MQSQVSFSKIRNAKLLFYFTTIFERYRSSFVLEYVLIRILFSHLGGWNVVSLDIAVFAGMTRTRQVGARLGVGAVVAERHHRAPLLVRPVGGRGRTRVQDRAACFCFGCRAWNKLIRKRYSKRFHKPAEMSEYSTYLLI